MFYYIFCSLIYSNKLLCIHVHLVLGNHTAYNIFMLSLKVPTCVRLLKFSTLEHAMKCHRVQISKHPDTTKSYIALSPKEKKKKKVQRSFGKHLGLDLTFATYKFSNLSKLLSVSDNTHLLGRS